jgi:proton glutamate symport protein
MKNKVLLAAASVAALVIAFLFLRAEFILTVSIIGQALRWLIIALIAAIAAKRRSLTSWILVGLLAGAEVGHDFPSFAANLQFLGTIFLRLIRVIIAPLLFGTLVVGIAGHADLKKVGRLGLKSLI